MVHLMCAKLPPPLSRWPNVHCMELVLGATCVEQDLLGCPEPVLHVPALHQEAVGRVRGEVHHREAPGRKNLNC